MFQFTFSNSEIYLHADDTAIIFPVNSYEELQSGPPYALGQ